MNIIFIFKFANYIFHIGLATTELLSKTANNKGNSHLATTNHTAILLHSTDKHFSRKHQKACGARDRNSG
ncbi:hypothetical protein QV13_08030 [Mesorhizobium hungaricum]|uniref:Uncharacterized protein n=1 Tax=Mesorhizobium hungaricum TaxID=1566387 RepID=A0A1C2E123_9HYPH|nr:hypothetical protein QV13_08030 [Mesorhizobium hungaricum]